MIRIEQIYVYKNKVYIVKSFPMIHQQDGWVKGVLYKGNYDPESQTDLFVREYKEFEEKFKTIEEVLKGTI